MDRNGFIKKSFFQHWRGSDELNNFLMEFLCRFTTRFLQITYFIRSCLPLRFFKYLLRHIFIWLMAFLKAEFIYGTCAFTVLILMGACLSNTDMNKLSFIQQTSSISSNISHTWKGIESTSFWKAFSEKCFILLYVILCWPSSLTHICGSRGRRVKAGGF